MPLSPRERGDNLRRTVSAKFASDPVEWEKHRQERKLKGEAHLAAFRRTIFLEAWAIWEGKRTNANLEDLVEAWRFYRR